MSRERRGAGWLWWSLSKPFMKMGVIEAGERRPLGNWHDAGGFEGSRS